MYNFHRCWRSNEILYRASSACVPAFLLTCCTSLLDLVNGRTFERNEKSRKEALNLVNRRITDWREKLEEFSVFHSIDHTYKIRSWRSTFRSSLRIIERLLNCNSLEKRRREREMNKSINQRFKMGKQVNSLFVAVTLNFSWEVKLNFIIDLFIIVLQFDRYVKLSSWILLSHSFFFSFVDNNDNKHDIFRITYIFLLFLLFSSSSSSSLIYSVRQ